MKKAVKNKRCDGAVLAMVLIIILVLSLLATTLLGLRADIGIAVSRDINDANAFWAAEAGLEQAKVIGQKQRQRYAKISKPVGYGMLLGSNVLSGAIGPGSYSVTIVEDPAWDNTFHALQKYIITASGAAPQGRTQVVSSHAWLLNFAGYLHASHTENGQYFGSGDVLDGPVHSDDRLHLLGPPGPVFKQLVSLATNCVDYTEDGFFPWNPTAAESNAVWQGGLIFNSVSLGILGQFGDNSDLQSQASAGGLTLAGPTAGDYYFNFIKDGSFTYSNRSSHAVKTNYLSALNGAIYVDGNI